MCDLFSVPKEDISILADKYSSKYYKIKKFMNDLITPTIKPDDMWYYNHLEKYR